MRHPPSAVTRQLSPGCARVWWDQVELEPHRKRAPSPMGRGGSVFAERPIQSNLKSLYWIVESRRRAYDQSSSRTPRKHRRSEAPGDPGLPADQGPARIRPGEAGTDLAFGKARLSDPRRHSDHAAGRGAQDRVMRWQLTLLPACPA